METFFQKSTALVLLLLLAAFSSITTANLTNQELDAAISALRSQGYNLFPNAIATSELRPLLLSSNSTAAAFTLFAPPDPLLYSLDLSSTAPHYVCSLLGHVSPSRFAMSDLRQQPSVETLLPNHRLAIGRSLALVNATVLQSVSLDGVRASVPDLFLGSGIAVHGLDGILVSDFGSDSEAELRDYSFDRWFAPPPVVTVEDRRDLPVEEEFASPPPVASRNVHRRSRNRGVVYGSRRRNQRGFGSVGGGGGGSGADVGHGNFARLKSRFGA